MALDTPITEPPRSKHALIAQAISLAIRNGRYKVGELLPSEAELSLTFGASRHTVRVALRNLQGMGLVVSQQGVGTYVHKAQVGSRYSHSFSSAADLLQYASTTRVKVLGWTEVAVDAAQAEYLSCKPGAHWWRIRTQRFAAKEKAPIAYSEILLPLAYSAILEEIAKGRQPVFALIEQHFNEAIVRIRQDIGAVTLSPAEAAELEVADDPAGLEITRRYIGKNNNVLEATRSVHPSTSFRYSMDVELKHSN